MKKKVILVVIILFTSIIFSNKINAQFTLENDDISVETTPDIPGPNETVQAVLVSYSVSLDTLYIEWYENETLTLAGFGEKNYIFDSGQVGQTKIITIKVKSEEKGSVLFTKSIVSKPAQIDILWQAVDSYTPPFYKGKALPSTEGIIKIVALPNFQVGLKTVSPKNVVYEWKRNYETISSASGYGKNTLMIKQSYLNDEEKIGVTATETTQGAVAKTLLTFKPYNPKIVFYKKDPLQGILFSNGIINTVNVGKNDTTLIASPYFISSLDPNDDDLEYTWSLNKNKIGTPETKNQIILRGTDQQGQATLGLVIESSSKLFLKITKEIGLILE